MLALPAIQNFSFLLAVNINIKAILYTLIILAAPFILLRLERKNARKELHLTKINYGKSLVDGLALFAVIFFVLIVQGLVLQALGLLDNKIVAELIAIQDPLTLILAFTLGPLGEELLFRGYLLNKLGVIVQGVLFGLFHAAYGSIAEVLAALTVGIILGVYMQRRKNIYACTLAHAFYNLFAIITVLSLKGAGAI